MSTIRTPLPEIHSSLRRLSEQLVLLLIAVLLMQTWYIEGLVLSCRVTSGSMAETLLGLHRKVVCEDCGYRFPCGSDRRPPSERAVCPNCGYDHNKLEDLPDIPGDGLLIHKSLFRLRRPQRWEVIAFGHPQWAAHTQIKRVVGLPGEKIEIRHGDVYIDGRIQRKDLFQQRAMAIPVHDASFQPKHGASPPPRWRKKSPDSPWGSAGGDFAHPETKHNKAIDWLEYRHWRRLPGLLRDLDESAVREDWVPDLSGYNQDLPRLNEDVHPVTDLMLSFQLVEASGDGRLAVRASDGSEQFKVWIDRRGNRYEVRQNDQAVSHASAVGKLPAGDDGLGIEISLFDQQFLLAFNGKVAACWQYEPAGPNRQPSSRPLAIGSQGIKARIRDVRVYRDVYYTRPVGVRARRGFDEPVQLGDDEYFVLGDNSPLSEDSRTWPGRGTVPADLLVGKPLVVHFPVRRVELGGWSFHIPDPARIRYIR